MDRNYLVQKHILLVFFKQKIRSSKNKVLITVENDPLNEYPM